MLVAHCLPFCWPRCRCSLWICTRTCLPLSRICTGIRPNPSHPIQWPQRLSRCVLLSWVPLSTCGELGFVMETDLVPNYPMGLQTSTPGVIVFACPGARSMSNDPEQCLLVEASQRSDLLGSQSPRLGGFLDAGAPCKTSAERMALPGPCTCCTSKSVMRRLWVKDLRVKPWIPNNPLCGWPPPHLHQVFLF